MDITPFERCARRFAQIRRAAPELFRPERRNGAQRRPAKIRIKVVRINK